MPNSFPNSFPNSLIDFRDWSRSEVEELFELSFSLEKQKPDFKFANKTAALLFFEPSTRTRISFEQACFREGIRPSLLSGKASTSLEKGETYRDTVFNVAAMGPDVLVIRSGYDLGLPLLREKISQPILNAGWGTTSHPTQALLDIRTLLKQRLTLNEIHLLIVGDVRHSRVAGSHFELASKMGYQVAVCCPENYKPQQEVKCFASLEEGLHWANAVMVLRFQFERHAQKSQMEDLMAFQIGRRQLESWENRGWLLHPGPVNYGVELKLDVEHYQRNLILSQVESGVWMRRACLRKVLEPRT